MAEDEDVSLLDLALGLRDDPELARAIRRSPELHKRFMVIEKDLRRLDDELGAIEADEANERHILRPGAWHILLAIDDSVPSARAVGAAAALAELCAGDVIVLHLKEVKPLRAGPAFESWEEAKQLVATVVERLLDGGVRAQGRVSAARPGQIAREIGVQARETGADLIVLGSRGPSEFVSLLTGSIAHQTMRYAGCPVLVVR